MADWSQYFQAPIFPSTLDALNKSTNDSVAFDPIANAAGMPSAIGLAGAPLPKFDDPLFHGSPTAGLTTLKASERGPLGPGVYATPFEGVGNRYAGDAGQLYQLPPKTRDIFNGLGDRYGGGYEAWKEGKQRLLNAAELDKRAGVQEILDKSWMNDGYPMYARLRQLYGDHEGAQGLFKRAGFEGLSGHVDGPEVVLFGDQPLDKR